MASSDRRPCCLIQNHNYKTNKQKRTNDARLGLCFAAERPAPMSSSRHYTTMVAKSTFKIKVYPLACEAKDFVLTTNNRVAVWGDSRVWSSWLAQPCAGGILPAVALRVGFRSRHAEVMMSRVAQTGPRFSFRLF